MKETLNNMTKEIDQFLNLMSYKKPDVIIDYKLVSGE